MHEGPDAIGLCDALYRRTLRTLISVVAQREIPEMLHGGWPIDGAYYFELHDSTPITAKQISALQSALDNLIASDAKIEEKRVPYADALKYFEKEKLAFSATLLKTRVVGETVAVHSIKKEWRLAIFPLLPSTGGVAQARPKLIPQGPGLFVVWNNSGGALEDFTPSQTLMTSFADHKAWDKMMGTECVGQLNELKAVGRELADFVLHSEFRQEGKLAGIAQAICERNSGAKSALHKVGVICIAGPTSSGKTTFATKLSMYLANAGFHAVPLSVDHYYLPLDQQPKYKVRSQRSDVDYDSIEAMDVPLVNEHINALLRGEEVLTPTYNMKTGYRDGAGKKFRLPEGQSILVIEGIHALNPEYTSTVPKERVFKIYISPLSALQLDETNAIRTTDHRLLRRMCRDFLFRGHSAARTLSMWQNVRRGEHTWIFPHQDSVDYVMNSGMEYELRVRAGARWGAVGRAGGGGP